MTVHPILVSKWLPQSECSWYEDRAQIRSVELTDETISSLSSSRAALSTLIGEVDATEAITTALSSGRVTDRDTPSEPSQADNLPRVGATAGRH
ncbi:hypothetical protein [Krasilnikovia sp. M28-CT-15]|uniref:hypothetical protein n=1 Tax=Krasilnikovia sp. M28-CT-15 TaxID=3373540 RepID=UPI0038772410